MQLRTVVTGQDAQGRSRIVGDETSETTGVPGVMDIALLWAEDALPRFPRDGAFAPCPDYFPPLAGYRFTVVTVPPEADVQVAVGKLGLEEMKTAAQAVEDRVGRGLFAVLEPGERGMHTTDTIDFGVVLSGQVWLELDDGQEAHLKAGDFFVQNGTRHRWFNRSDETATLAVVLIGGHPRPRSAT